MTKRGCSLQADIDPSPDAPDVFVASWLDYCTKYGMGFAMNDGTICVHFNDSSSLALAPGKQHFDYIHPSDDMLSGQRESHRMDAVPSELKNKVYLTQHFQSYILDRLTGNYEYLYNNVELRTGMVFISKYLRMKHVIVFRLSNDVIQVSRTSSHRTALADSSSTSMTTPSLSCRRKGWLSQ
jgi:hypothetical protein